MYHVPRLFFVLILFFLPNVSYAQSESDEKVSPENKKKLIKKFNQVLENPLCETLRAPSSDQLVPACYRYKSGNLWYQKKVEFSAGLNLDKISDADLKNKQEKYEYNSMKAQACQAIKDEYGERGIAPHVWSTLETVQKKSTQDASDDEKALIEAMNTQGPSLKIQLHSGQSDAWTLEYFKTSQTLSLTAALGTKQRFEASAISFKNGLGMYRLSEGDRGTWERYTVNVFYNHTNPDVYKSWIVNNMNDTINDLWKELELIWPNDPALRNTRLCLQTLVEVFQSSPDETIEIPEAEPLEQAPARTAKFNGK